VDVRKFKSECEEGTGEDTDRWDHLKPKLCITCDVVFYSLK
jgi:hypothetical protein